MEDQRGFNMLVTEKFHPIVAAPGIADGSVVRAANNSISLMPLPARRFCSGHTFFIQQSGSAREVQHRAALEPPPEAASAHL